MVLISLASKNIQGRGSSAPTALKWLVACLVLAALTLHPVSALAEMLISVSTNYYVVSGSNYMSIRAAMTEMRPWKETNSYDGNTEWDVRTRLTWRRVDDRYFLASYEVRTKIVMTLPCLNPTRPINHALAAQWQAFFQALCLHEQGHVQVARAATAELERRLSELAGHNSAEDLPGTARRITKEVLDEFRKKDAAYDEVTRHGATQGAVFVPRRLAAQWKE